MKQSDSIARIDDIWVLDQVPVRVSHFYFFRQNAAGGRAQGIPRFHLVLTSAQRSSRVIRVKVIDVVTALLLLLLLLLLSL
jgi:hypothetical protein